MQDEISKAKKNLEKSRFFFCFFFLPRKSDLLNQEISSHPFQAISCYFKPVQGSFSHVQPLPRISGKKRQICKKSFFFSHLGLAEFAFYNSADKETQPVRNKNGDFQTESPIPGVLVKIFSKCLLGLQMFICTKLIHIHMKR